MFTGIIEEIGSIAAIKRGAASSVLTIAANRIFEDLHLGDSVAVNGVCLTASSFTANSFTADVMHETLEHTSLGFLQRGSEVNLERAMAAGGRFGGHIVSGHVDGCATISLIKRDDNALWYTCTATPEILKYIVLKGSIAIDGISLTVARLGARDFAVSMIPHTAAQTTLASKKVGDIVNLETDVIGKYVERLLSFESDEDGTKANKSNISMDFLMKHGY